MLYGLSTGFFSTEFSFDPRKMMPRIARCGFDFAHVSLDTAFVQKGKAWWSELKQICDDCNLIFDPGMGWARIWMSPATIPPSAKRALIICWR